MTKQIIYCGSTTDGKRHYFEIAIEDSVTGNVRNFAIDEKEQKRKEYYPFLEDL